MTGLGATLRRRDREMTRWSQTPQETQHVTDMLLKALSLYQKVTTIVLIDGSSVSGKIFKSGKSNDNTRGLSAGYVIIENQFGEFAVDVLDIASMT